MTHLEYSTIFHFELLEDYLGSAGSIYDWETRRIYPAWGERYFAMLFSKPDAEYLIFHYNEECSYVQRVNDWTQEKLESFVQSKWSDHAR